MSTEVTANILTNKINNGGNADRILIPTPIIVQMGHILNGQVLAGRQSNEYGLYKNVEAFKHHLTG